MAISDLVLDKEGLQEIGVRLIDRLHAAADEVVDRAIQQLSAQANSLVLQASNVGHGLVTGAQAIEDKAMADINRSIQNLDGWTLTVQLHKPKETK